MALPAAVKDALRERVRKYNEEEQVLIGKLQLQEGDAVREQSRHSKEMEKINRNIGYFNERLEELHTNRLELVKALEDGLTLVKEE